MDGLAKNTLACRPIWFIWLAAGFLTYHSVAVLHTLVPDWGMMARLRSDLDKESSEHRPAAAQLAELAERKRRAETLPSIRPGDGAFLKYRILTGTRQDWQMFHVPPRDSDLEIHLEARDSNQQVHQLGPILPGFRDADLLVDDRYYHLWVRFEFWNDMAYIQTYLENVGQLLKESEEPVYKDVTLIYRKHVIQSPDEIARTGQISKVVTREWWSPRDAWGD